MFGWIRKAGSQRLCWDINCSLYLLDYIAIQIRSFHRTKEIQVLQHIFLRMTIMVANAREPRWFLLHLRINIGAIGSPRCLLSHGFFPIDIIKQLQKKNPNILFSFLLDF